MRAEINFEIGPVLRPGRAALEPYTVTVAACTAKFLSIDQRKKKHVGGEPNIESLLCLVSKSRHR